MTLGYLYSKFFKKYIRGKSIINSSIDNTAVINSGSSIVSCRIGKYSYCGYDCDIVNCNIGSFCSISDHVFIGGPEHPMEWISTSPVFQNVKHSGPRKKISRFVVDDQNKTIIGHDVWIGHGVSIKQGVVIATGAVVGTGAVVTKDVPPYAVVAGCPAKIIKYRFTEEIISELLKSEWWNLSEDNLRKAAEYIREPLKFVEYLKNSNNEF